MPRGWSVSAPQVDTVVGAGTFQLRCDTLIDHIPVKQYTCLIAEARATWGRWASFKNMTAGEAD